MSPLPTHSLVKALRSVPDFAALDDRTLLQIVGASANLLWSAGSVVFEEGSVSEALFVVLSGRVRILDRRDGDETEVAVVGAGESFGELSLLLARVHSKTAVALEDTELMVLPKETLEHVLASNPGVAATFRRRIEERRPVRGEVPDSA